MCTYLLPDTSSDLALESKVLFHFVNSWVAVGSVGCDTLFIVCPSLTRPDGELSTGTELPDGVLPLASLMACRFCSEKIPVFRGAGLLVPELEACPLLSSQRTAGNTEQRRSQSVASLLHVAQYPLEFCKHCDSARFIHDARYSSELCVAALLVIAHLRDHRIIVPASRIQQYRPQHGLSGHNKFLYVRLVSSTNSIMRPTCRRTACGAVSLVLRTCPNSLYVIQQRPLPSTSRFAVPSPDWRAPVLTTHAPF